MDTTNTSSETGHCEHCAGGSCMRHHMMHGAHGMLGTVVAVAFGVLALWGLAQTITTLKEYRFIGSGTTATNTIAVDGKGEVFSVPDIATFSVSVEETEKQVSDAQSAASKKMNAIIAYVKESGVAEKDIKTTDYNVYPKYTWQQGACDSLGRCPGGEQVLDGYTVTQTISIKVRVTEKAGEILSGAGSRGATNVSGLTFTVDDEEKVLAEARTKAIADAQEKAEELADELGVELVRIVGFYENGAAPQPMMYAKTMASGAAYDIAESAPSLPTGENKITSNVSITYEIR